MSNYSPAIQGQGIAGGGFGMAAAVNEQSKPQITHIEVRRVQNGFVVMAINVKLMEAPYGSNGQPQRWSYVAKDTKELGDLLTMIVDGGCDIEWVPSMDLPMVDLVRRKVE